jgi:transposase-like protein
VGTFGRGAAGKSVVVIAVEIKGRKIGRIRLGRVPNAAASSLQGAVQQMVAPGAEVHPDAWRGYASLKNWGYAHRVLGATAGELLLPHVHRVASLLKRWVLGTHQGAVAPDHLDFYLDEYTFCFNRRAAGDRGLLFYRLLQQSIALALLRNQQLVGGLPFSPCPLRGNNVHS